MPTFSLREAAQEAGTSKSTILRAIQSGRLSAARTDDGGYAIDPSELSRVYPPKPNLVVVGQCDTDREGQNAPAFDTAKVVELRVRFAQLEAAFEGLKSVLEAERRRGEELRVERDRWAAQAERLALPAPQAKPQASDGFMTWAKRVRLFPKTSDATAHAPAPFAPWQVLDRLP
jgi:excisionase family DNA binding protein